MKFLSVVQYIAAQKEALSEEAKNELEGNWAPIKRSYKQNQIVIFYAAKKFVYQNPHHAFNNVAFKFVGYGSFNIVYEFNDPKTHLRSVIKFTISDIGRYFLFNRAFETVAILEQANHCLRSINLWNEINLPIAEPAYLLKLSFPDSQIEGWVTEYLEPVVITRSELCLFLYDIELKCNRVIVDIVSPNNVSKKNGNLICLDVSFAIKLIKKTETLTPSSPVSSSFWELMRGGYDEYFGNFSNNGRACKDVVQMIKSLLYISTLNLLKAERQQLSFRDIDLYKDLLAVFYDNQPRGLPLPITAPLPLHPVLVEKMLASRQFILQSIQNPVHLTHQPSPPPSSERESINPRREHHLKFHAAPYETQLRFFSQGEGSVSVYSKPSAVPSYGAILSIATPRSTPENDQKEPLLRRP